MRYSDLTGAKIFRMKSTGGEEGWVGTDALDLICVDTLTFINSPTHSDEALQKLIASSFFLVGVGLL